MFFRWFWFGLRASVYPLFQMQVWNTCHMRRVHTGYLRWTPALAPLSQIWELPSVVSWSFPKRSVSKQKQENRKTRLSHPTLAHLAWQKLPIFHRISLICSLFSPSTLPLRSQQGLRAPTQRRSCRSNGHRLWSLKRPEMFQQNRSFIPLMLRSIMVYLPSLFWFCDFWPSWP